MDLERLKETIHDAQLDTEFFNSSLSGSNLFWWKIKGYDNLYCFLSIFGPFRWGDKCDPVCMKGCAQSCINSCSVSKQATK